MRSRNPVWSAFSLAALAGLAATSMAAPIPPSDLAPQAGVSVDGGGILPSSKPGVRGVTCNPISDITNCHTSTLTLGANFSNLGSANFRTMDNFTPTTSNPTELCWIGRYQNRVNPIPNESFRVRIYADSAGFPNLGGGPIFERTFTSGGVPGVSLLESACLAGDTCPGTTDPVAGGHWVFSAAVTGGFPVTGGSCYWLEVANAGSSQPVGGCATDWNDDGMVNSSDISSFLTSWLASLQQGNLVADFDGNGMVNSSDVSAFLTAWLGEVGDPCTPTAGVLWGWVGSTGGTDITSLQAIDGAYTVFTRVANDRSFCFNGGVDPFAGNCTIVPPPPICENDDANGTGGGTLANTIFRSNLPGSNGGNVWTPFEIADNFAFASPASVSNICFNGYWGLTPAGGGAVPAAPEVPMDRALVVTYYANAGAQGVPGDPVPMASFAVGDPGVTLLDNAATATYQASIDHPPVNFTANTCHWVSVARVNTFGQPEFFWTAITGTSPATDNRIAFRSHLNNPAGPWGGFDGFNVAWLLDAGPVIAADCTTEPPPPPPANDLCDNAVALPTPPPGAPITVDSTTISATLETVPVCAGVDGANPGPGVWYTVTGTGALMTASMCTSPAPYDSQISIFSGTCAALTCLAGGDDTCGQGGGPSTASWSSTAGTTYRIFVHGWGGATGNFRLVVSTN